MTTLASKAIPKRILTVCLGNICRSPSAQVILRTKCEQAGLDIDFDSAGTSGHTTGLPPDKRTIKVGAKRGYDLTTLVARKVSVADFYRFDLILAMDKQNLQDLKRLYAIAQQQNNAQSLATLTLYDPNQAVDDPYYGDIEDFVRMYQHLEQVADDYVKQWANNECKIAN